MTQAVTTINGCVLSISGRVLRIATVRDEPYDCIKDPVSLIDTLRKHHPRVDIFSFMQEINDTTPRHAFHMEVTSLAVLPISSFENWWSRQVNDKTRNLVRKSQKSKVDVKVVPLDDELVRGIKDVYDESSVRQGKAFKHFQKPLDILKMELCTFQDRSTFIGAYLQGSLIGFAKLVQGNEVSSLMHIISKLSERNKAPTNALIAKAVEICAERGIAYLHYGVWSTGGLGMFKENHAFQKRDIPRYFVPVSAKGRLALKMGMHRPLKDRLPERLRQRIVAIRNRLRSGRTGTTKS